MTMRRYDRCGQEKANKFLDVDAVIVDVLRRLLLVVVVVGLVPTPSTVHSFSLPSKSSTSTLSGMRNNIGMDENICRSTSSSPPSPFLDGWCHFRTCSTAADSCTGTTTALSASLGNIIEPRPPPSSSSSSPSYDGAMIMTQGTATELDWSVVADQVYVITCPNADSQNDRITSTKQILDRINLLHLAQIKEFQTDDENRVRGCYTSHIQVLREAMSTPSKKSKSLKSKVSRNMTPSQISSPSSITSSIDSFFNEIFRNIPASLLRSSTDGDGGCDDDARILVFEDNLAIGDGGGRGGAMLTQDSLDAIASYLNEKAATRDDDDNEGWDILHLCYNPYVPNLQISRTENEKIVKLSSGEGSALGTTAYVINKGAMRKLLEEDDRVGYSGEAIPDVMARLFPTTRFATNPTIFVRAPATKSLVNPQLDDLRQVLFQPAVASFAQRLLVMTGLSTNILLPLVVLGLLLTSLGSMSVSFSSVVQYLETGSLDGPWIVPAISVVLSVFSLAVIIQGALLAPKPDKRSQTIDDGAFS